MGVDWVVLKFGGTSVATRQRWETIHRVVCDHLAAGRRPMVVCSAVSGISDAIAQLGSVAGTGGDPEVAVHAIVERHRALARALEVDLDDAIGDIATDLGRLALGASLIGEVTPRLQARLMSAGELMSTRLGAAFLRQQGLDCQWHDARQLVCADVAPATVSSRGAFLEGAGGFSTANDLLDRVQDGQVALTQGFIAGRTNDDGGRDTVLLGRGGSDTSAAVLAAGLGASRLEIWTDVPGMFTANPRHVGKARLLHRLSYTEAQELASMGAKVLHPRCLEPVRNARIPLFIRSTLMPAAPGTRVDQDEADQAPQVKAIASRSDIALISMNTVGMWQQPGFLAEAFATFSKNGLSVDLVSTSQTNVTVSLDTPASEIAPTTREGLLASLSEICRPSFLGPVSSVSLVGRGIRSSLHAVGPILQRFADNEIHLVSQSATDVNLTLVVDPDQATHLLVDLHQALFGHVAKNTTFGPTWRELSEDPPAPRPTRWWERRRTDLLEMADSTPIYVYDKDTLNARATSLVNLGAVDRVFFAMKANPNPDVLQVLHDAGVGFECVSTGELARLDEVFGLENLTDRVLFTPNFAKREDYERGFEVGALVTLDGTYPLEHWPGTFAGRKIMVRVDPGQGRGHHRFVRTAGAQSKFGVPPERMDRMVELVQRHNVQVVALHAHAGSGIRSSDAWLQTAVFLQSLAVALPSVKALDLGGGLGVVERPDQAPLDLAEVDAGLSAFRAAHPDLELWLEPGRFLVAEAGVLLTRCTQRKQKGDRQYVGVDAGLNTLIRPALYGAWHEIRNLSAYDEPATLTADVVGPICETGDVLGHGRALPETQGGDLLLVGTAGAYGRAMSSDYNLRGWPAEFLLT